MQVYDAEFDTGRTAARPGQQPCERLLSDHHRSVALEGGAEREAAGDADLHTVQFGLRRGGIHSKEPPRTSVYQNGFRLAQLLRVPLDLGQTQDRMVGIKSQGSDEENLPISRVLPEHVKPGGIKRPS